MSSASFRAKLAPCSCVLATFSFFCFLLQRAPQTVMADSLPRVELISPAAAPRAMESRTQQSIVRDYTYAWKNLADAFDQNSPDLLNGYFTSTAQKELATVVAEQQKSGLRTQYLNQSHKLDIVFYAPEGDVMELHDTAEFDFQLLDGGKVIHNDHEVLHYVVLLTPGADRWVVRQLQAVTQF